MNEELAAKGYIQKADTLEELAGKLGLPADALIATVERNNENYDNQVDPDFGKEPFRLSPVRNPPFYGIRNTGMLLCTMDGININTQGQALSADGSVIEGLYVTGNDSGGYLSLIHIFLILPRVNASECETATQDPPPDRSAPDGYGRPASGRYASRAL